MWVSPNCHPLFPFSMKSHLELQFGNKSNNEAVKRGGNFLTIVCQAKMLWRHLTKTFLVGNIFSQKANARFCGSHKECFRTKAAAFFSSQRVNKSQLKDSETIFPLVRDKPRIPGPGAPTFSRFCDDT